MPNRHLSKSGFATWIAVAVLSLSLHGELAQAGAGLGDDAIGQAACEGGRRTVKRTLRDGQSVVRLLDRMGVPAGERVAAVRALKPLFDVGQRARPGDVVEVTMDRRGRILRLSYVSKRRGNFYLRLRDDRLTASRRPPPPLEEDAPKEATRDKASGAPRDAEADKPQGRGPSVVQPVAVPDWLVPVGEGEAVKTLARYLATPSNRQTARATLAAALERDLGVQGVEALLKASFAPRADPTPGVFRRTISWPEGPDIEAVVYVPDDYDPRTPMPLHISLHGKSGTGPRACKHRWSSPQPGWLIACPTSAGGIWHGAHGQAAVMGLYRQMLRDYAVDTSRVVLGGHSNGGNGTWQLGARFAWLWSALVPRSGAMLARDKWRHNMLNLPVFIVHGTEDVHIGVNHARQMVTLLTEAGRPPRYVEIDGGGHDFFTHLNPEIFDWMADQRRAAPQSFKHHMLQHERAERVYWLLADRTGTLDVTLSEDRAHTLLDIDTQWPPRKLVAYLRAPIVDPSRSVRARLNGEVVYEGRPSPSVQVLLDTFAQTGDLTRATPYAVKLK